MAADKIFNNVMYKINNGKILSVAWRKFKINISI